MPLIRVACASAACLLLLAICCQRAEAEQPAAVDRAGAAQATSFEPADVEFFEQRVRPLLTARCHECHGPQQQKGGLRLDARAAIVAGGDTGAAIVPGMPEESLLVDAIRYGETYQMPPKSQLPAEEIATLVEWVRRGAPWGADAAPWGADAAPAADAKGVEAFDLKKRSGHWSFQPVSPAEPPQVDDEAWIKTPVDRFILASLAKAGLKPAPPADKHSLLRRITYDLIGLPPTPPEITAFLGDDAAGAYERVVERLLASPRYGERWARHWLDLVRYAETHGHEFDFDMPNAYRYRDYVIRALNDDLPFDQFVVEHLAGDLVGTPRRHPIDGTNESIVGTGWFFFGEAKHSPVDVRQDEADRIDNQIDVFAKTFLGLTVSCARCHDHKFDAITTKDYYALAGYLQSSRYQQAFIDDPAVLDRPLAELSAIQDARGRASDTLAREALLPALDGLAERLVQATSSSADWKKYLDDVARPNPAHVFHAWAVLVAPVGEGADQDFATRRARLVEQLRGPGAAQPPTGATVLADFSDGTFGRWTATGAAFGTAPARALSWSASDAQSRFPGQVVGTPAVHSGLLSKKLRGVLRSPTFTIEGPQIWYRVYGEGSEVRLIVDGLQLIQNPIYGGLKFSIDKQQPYWHAQDVSKWIGHKAYIELVDDGDGYAALEQVVLCAGSPPAAAPNPLVVAALDDTSLTSVDLLAQRYQALFRQVLAEYLAGGKSSNDQAEDRAEILNWMFEHPLIDLAPFVAPVQALQQTRTELDARQRAIETSLVQPRRAMAMADGTAENEHVFIRGSHKTLGDEVPRRLLEVLGGTRQAPPEQGSGRLALAEQLVSPSNPLVSRVIVNRLWHHHFGAGLVRSPDDFGVMGQPPTHPELLDYLATQLVREGWSLKAMHRQMVLSNTYRMSSQLNAEADQLDPQNKLWHRMAVRRLEAEAIRDAMLAVSGRLDLKQYGPSVMPYLSPGMTGRGRPANSGPADGEGRRSIYLAVRRNFLSPMFQAFDYPTPFTTIGRRSTSNVPAQALAMMNNPLVIEQARLWAERVQLENWPTANERIGSMYLTAFGRPATPEEIAEARAFVEQGEGHVAATAWSDLAHVLLNAKEFIFIP